MNMLCQSDELLIIGDSFCADRSRIQDWPKHLLKLATGSDGIPRGMGWPGASWWSTRNTLFNEFRIKMPKILIICHTEPMRIPSDYHFGLNAGSATGKFPICSPIENELYYSDDVKTAAAMYYKHLMSDNFHWWANDRWYKELDTLLLANHQIQVIHLKSFEIRNCFRSGITSKEILSTLCPNKGPSNHFTFDQNLQIAKSLYKTLCGQIEFQFETGCEYNLGLLK